jgi:hypothetical protein
MEDRALRARCPKCDPGSRELRVTYGDAPAGYVYCTTHGLQWLDAPSYDDEDTNPPR